MSDLHILFPTPVYQNVLDFRPSELKSMLDFMSELEWAPDRDIVNRLNGETTKLEADLLIFSDYSVSMKLTKIFFILNL